MTDNQIEAVLHVFGTDEERKQWKQYKYDRDHHDEIVAREAEKLAESAMPKIREALKEIGL